MKLIIDIPDKVYNEYREGVMSMENNCIIGNAVFDGIPYEERPQGEWIPNYTSQFCNPGRACSLCGKVVEFSENYCPNCGAYMRG